MVNFVTLNVKGLNSDAKRRLALQELRALKADIAFLQETHFNSKGSFSFAQASYPTVYSAHSNRKSAGVAILVSRNCPLQVDTSVLDPGGRYIILQGTLYGKHVTLCNVYIPNVSQTHFLARVLNKLSKSPPGALLLGGDFNLIFSDRVDRHSVHGRPPNRNQINISKTFRQLIRKHGLYDLWRINHPTDRSYSFYSHPHMTHTRIDYFFGNLLTLRMLSDASIAPITWSDHAPVSLTMKLNSVPLRACHWRLNEYLLKNPDYREELRKSVSSYFELNAGSVSSASVLWEAHKAVFRGNAIELGSRLKKSAKAQDTLLRGRLRRLEERMFANPTIRTLRGIVEVRSRLKELAMKGVEKLLLYSKRKYYEFGNKAHTFLARRLKDRAVQAAPQALKRTDGTLMYEPRAMADVFRDFFSKLYSLSEGSCSNSEHRGRQINSFLTTCSLPQLSEEAVNSLNAPIDLEKN